MALALGRRFHANRSAAQLVFWSVYECKQEAKRVGGPPVHMSGCLPLTEGHLLAVLTAGTSSFLTSSTALLILISALDCVSSTVSRT